MHEYTTNVMNVVKMDSLITTYENNLGDAGLFFLLLGRDW